MQTSEIKIVRTHGDDPRFRLLEEEFDTSLEEINGPLHETFYQINHAVVLEHVSIALLEGVPCGIGGLKLVGEGTFELKRIFVRPQARGLGVGERTVADLISWARSLDGKRLILETAIELKAAQRLYERLGFRRIENYPPYEQIASSLCYELKL